MIWSGESRLRVAGTQEQGIFLLLLYKMKEMIIEGQMGYNWMTTSFISMMSMEMVVVFSPKAPRGSFYITVS